MHTNDTTTRQPMKATLVAVLSRLPLRISRRLAGLLRHVWPGFGAA